MKKSLKALSLAALLAFTVSASTPRNASAIIPPAWECSFDEECAGPCPYSAYFCAHHQCFCYD
jgi:hypothetical protein